MLASVFVAFGWIPVVLNQIWVPRLLRRQNAGSPAAGQPQLLPIHDGAQMRATVFGNQAYIEVEFDDYLRTTGIPLLYRARLTELADATGGTAIFISGFDDSPYMKGNLMGSALNSLVKISGYNSKRLAEIAEQTRRKVERHRRVRKARITGSERFGRTTNEETLISLSRDVLADHGLTVLEVVTTVRRLLGLDRVESIPYPIPGLGWEVPFTLRWLDTSNQDIWHNLALTSIGSLLSSTVLIVLSLPALYYASVRLGWVLRKLYPWVSNVYIWGTPELARQ